MVIFGTISSYVVFFLHPHRPVQEPVQFGSPALSPHRHIPSSLRVCEMVLPSGKYSIEPPNKQIIRRVWVECHPALTRPVSRD